MRFAVEFPMPAAGGPAPTLLGAVVAEFAAAVERAGCHGIAFTDHPAPSAKWLAAGGHASFDPYVALGFCAALTQRIALLSHLSVLPYRNPLLTVRAAFSLDVLSGGRLVLCCGAGYLRSEFAALGVDFAERNQLLDEALATLTTSWGAPAEVSGRGLHWSAVGQAFQPGPVQPFAPLWIGGNSRAALRRVAAYGHGWSALVASPDVAQTSRTRAITTLDELQAAIGELRAELRAVGRDPATVQVCVPSPGGPLVDRDGRPRGGDELRDEVARLEALGVTWVLHTTHALERTDNLAALERFGREVVTP